MTKRVKIKDWLRELETTNIPQTYSIGSFGDRNYQDGTCALGIACMLADEPMNTAIAYDLLGFESVGADCRVGEAVYHWNDIKRLTFPQIAAKFREKYPELIEQDD